MEITRHQKDDFDWHVSTHLFFFFAFPTFFSFHHTVLTNSILSSPQLVLLSALFLVFLSSFFVIYFFGLSFCVLLK